jgi:CheY-like chemotaxis protein
MVGQLSSRVLVVDDEPLMRTAISAYLVAAGYVVRAAVDGLDAVQKLRAGVPDLIISDLDMPRMSGVELLHIVRQRFPHLPIIAMTAGSLPDDLPPGSGADVYYHKSGLSFDILLQSVTKLTRRSSVGSTAAIPEDKPVRARLDGDRHYIIDCEDCLRSFSVPRERCCTGQNDQWTTCVHCGSTIPFLIDSHAAQG